MQTNEAPKTVIAEDVEIVGTIKSSSHIRFDGKLSGDLSCNGNAIIGNSATVKGNVAVESVTVSGQVNGNITAKDRIELKATARLNGDIRSKRLTVEDGVTFIGKSEVNPAGGSGTRGPAPDAKPGSDTAGEEPPVHEAPESGGRSGGFFSKK